ncbi:unnamed protein product [Diplocarpon coronariae]|nr:hypothetical protein JHW43_007089 [Diplocarpon mali]
MAIFVSPCRQVEAMKSTHPSLPEPSNRRTGDLMSQTRPKAPIFSRSPPALPVLGHGPFLTDYSDAPCPCSRIIRHGHPTTSIYILIPCGISLYATAFPNRVLIAHIIVRHFWQILKRGKPKLKADRSERVTHNSKTLFTPSMNEHT